MDGEGTAFTVSEERNRGCDPICALALACPHALPGQRAARDRQQLRRAGAACRCDRQEKLPLYGCRLRRPASCRALQPHWNRQAEWPRSCVLSSAGPGNDQRLRDASPRGTVAMEDRRLPPDRLIPSRLDPLNKCPLKNKWTLQM